ncbi:hypothetical protein DLAC_11433 [Tieghemostelium lacteum]|uniref:Beta-hexosaminidase n=1 Tax=Tieghemostelium lacteum TaxID=361077 RepID=A0A152A9B6_TIELA|nr:hypothetical protein DLAC_11433 [Tieghemostelium lacteum]|eukprot:KYR02721.1 hypothetical protein DLAC_11433 [Tieghemostelium lacteum]
MHVQKLIFLVIICIFIDCSNCFRDDVVKDLYPYPRLIQYSDEYQYGPDCVLVEHNMNALVFNNDSIWSKKEMNSIRLFYRNLYKDFRKLDSDSFSAIPTFQLLKIELIKFPVMSKQDYDDSFNDTVPFGANEYYDLRIFKDAVTIYSHSKFGVYQALKTMASLSLVYQDTFCVKYIPFRIQDQPRFKYRGLLLDTGRSYFSIDSIKEIIRGLSLLRYNVLHWHLVDDQSFSMEMLDEFLQDLHLKGAYHLGYIHNQIPITKGKFYTQKEIKSVVRYAEERGIRVIPEIDLPGHARSWDVAYKLGAQCPMFMKSTRYNSVNLEYTYSIPLDISRNYTVNVIQGVLKEIVNLFTDPLIHLGGDEVDIRCWAEDKEMQKRMEELGYTSPTTYIDYFKKILKDIKHTILVNKTVIQWEDILSPMDITKDSHTIYQLWKGDDSLKQLKEKKSRFIYSFGNYLDPSYQSCQTFEKCYNQSKLLELEKNFPNQFIGVEACAWEMIEQDNVQSLESNGLDKVERSFNDTVWYKLIAISEKLWTQPMHQLPSNISLYLKRAQIQTLKLSHIISIGNKTISRVTL